MQCVNSWLLFEGQGADIDELLQGLRKPEKAAEEGKVLCKNCHHFITHQSLAIDYEGTHIHQRSNPHGYSFRFACYQDAAGCSETGAPSYEHSWFPGCSWQISVCRHCGEHLGWLFDGSASFYGLITARLVDERSP